MSFEVCFQSRFITSAHCEREDKSSSVTTKDNMTVHLSLRSVNHGAAIKQCMYERRTCSTYNVPLTLNNVWLFWVHMTVFVFFFKLRIL